MKRTVSESAFTRLMQRITVASIRHVMVRCNGNRGGACDILGISRWELFATMQMAREDLDDEPLSPNESAILALLQTVPAQGTGVRASLALRSILGEIHND